MPQEEQMESAREQREPGRAWKPGTECRERGTTSTNQETLLPQPGELPLQGQGKQDTVSSDHWHHQPGSNHNHEFTLMREKTTGMGDT